MHASSIAINRIAAQTEHRLSQKYRAIQALFNAQPGPIRFFLDTQAQSLAEAVVRDALKTSFLLPDWVVCQPGFDQPALLPARYRCQKLGSWKDRLSETPLLTLVDRRLTVLEHVSHPAVVAGAVLIRYATVSHLVQGLLPPISSVALSTTLVNRGALTGQDGEQEPGFVLLEGSRAPIHRYVRIFQAAFRLASYVAVDEDYREKRHHILGRWLDQCHALAIYETEQLIWTLRRRAETQGLNRGLSLSLPYFDDQYLEVRLHDFPVIPGGRIPFDPALIEAAAREEQIKVSEDLQLSSATRLHLIAELRMIEKAFEDRPYPKITEGIV